MLYAAWGLELRHVALYVRRSGSVWRAFFRWARPSVGRTRQLSPQLYASGHFLLCKVPRHHEDFAE